MTEWLIILCSIVISVGISSLVNILLIFNLIKEFLK